MNTKNNNKNNDKILEKIITPSGDNLLVKSRDDQNYLFLENFNFKLTPNKFLSLFIKDNKLILDEFPKIVKLLKLNEERFIRNRNYTIYQDLIKNDYWKPKNIANTFVSNLHYPIIHPNKDQIIKELQNDYIEYKPIINILSNKLLYLCSLKQF